MSRLFSSDPAEVVRARRMVRAHLQAWGYATEIEAMTLAVSELVTNAVIHGRGLVELTLTEEDGTIRVEVADHGGGQPKLAPPGAAADRGGLGLRVVDELADDWGSNRDGARTSVWAERHAPTTSEHGTDREPSPSSDKGDGSADDR